MSAIKMATLEINLIRTCL